MTQLDMEFRKYEGIPLNYLIIETKLLAFRQS